MLRKSLMLLVAFVFFGYGTLYAADTLENAIEKDATYIASMKFDGNRLSEYQETTSASDKDNADGNEKLAAEVKKRLSEIKKVLDKGTFSNGLYLGYMGYSNKPIGISFGEIHEKLFDHFTWFIDIGLGLPAFRGYEGSDDLSYEGRGIVQGGLPDFYYIDENKNTALLTDVVLGLNFKIIKKLLWVNIGGGFEFRQDYKLYSEISENDVKIEKTWIRNDSDIADKFKFVVSAGVYVKIWHLYFQGKYKFVFGEEVDMSDYGSNHFGWGIGYVWRNPWRK
jgi:hypothetical protein